ncbi:MAG: hypothetical protein AAGH79_10230 [Bacteroidota bacterium]
MNVWIITAALSVAVGVLLAFLQMLGISDPTEAWVRGRISGYLTEMEALAQEASILDTGTYRVVVVGSSLTQAGVDKDSIFSQRFRSHGLNIQLFRTFSRGGSNEMLWTPAFYEAIMRLEPNLVLLEDQVFAFRPREQHKLHFPFWIRNFNFTVNKLLENRLQVRELLSIPETKNKYFKQYLQYDQETALVDTVHYQLPRRRVRGRNFNPLFDERIEAWNKAGIQVVIYHVPRPAAIETQFLSRRERDRYEGLLNSYKADYGIGYWKKDWALPFASYFDDKHLNQRGRHQYSNWLFEQITTHVEQNMVQ